jgi:uncharacterized membrane protein YbhN (UPF0104 family)
MPFPLIQILYFIAAALVVGVLLWGLNQFPTLDGTIRNIIRVVIIVVFAIYVIYFLVGMVASLPGGGYPSGPPYYPGRR